MSALGKGGMVAKEMQSKPHLNPPLSKGRQGRAVEDNWIHRSAEMRCRTCMFFVIKGDKQDGRIGRCRQHAPTIKGWPVIFDSDWCGDHKLDEEKI